MSETTDTIDRRHIHAFLEMCSAERGAAKNTLDAYERDLIAFAGFAARKGRAPEAADTETIRPQITKRRG